MNISQVSNNVPVAAQTKAEAPKRQSAEQAIDQVRLDGQQNIDSGNALKDQAAQLKAAAQGAYDTAGQTIATGQAEVQAGVTQVASGVKGEKDGVTSLQANITAEQAATQKGSDSLDAIGTGIAGAHDLNTQLGTGAAVLGLGILGEALVIDDVKKNVQGLSDKTAAGAAIQGQMVQDNAGLNTAFESEKTASGQVSENVKNFSASLDAFNSSSDTLRQGLADSVAGFNLNKQGKDDLLSAQTRRDWAGTYSAQADEYATESAGLAGQGSQQIGKGVGLLAAANDLNNQSADSLAVADLLAQVAGIDADAGSKLQAIPSFVNEGSATIADADDKTQQSADKTQEGQGYAALAGSKAQQGADALVKGKNLFKQAEDAGKLSKKYGDQANSTNAEADALEAAGNNLIAQGKDLSDKGVAETLTGTAGRLAAQADRDTAEKGIQDGFTAEAAANTAQAASLGALGTGAQALDANLGERAPLVANVGKDVKNIGDLQAGESQQVAAAQDTTTQLEANVTAREQNANDLSASVNDRETALNNQSAALDQITAGGKEAFEGAGKVRHGNYTAIAGQAQQQKASTDLQAADEKDQAGTILVDKGTKYVAAADAAAEKLK